MCHGTEIKKKGAEMREGIEDTWRRLTVTWLKRARDSGGQMGKRHVVESGWMGDEGPVKGQNELWAKLAKVKFFLWYYSNHNSCSKYLFPFFVPWFMSKGQ